MLIEVFDTKDIMQTFCTEPLLLKGYDINFRPQNFFSKKPKTLLNVNLINVPTETPDQPLTDYLSEYADILGEPLYIQQERNGIPYYNGTRVYQVQTIRYKTYLRHVRKNSPMYI